MDKNKAMIKFLLSCPTIEENPLFFNFAHTEDGNNHFITEKDSVITTYIDGTVQKQYTFSIANYSSVSHDAVIRGEDENLLRNENLENMAKVQEILDWINEQSNNLNFPDFGEGYDVDEMTTLTTDPDIDGIDTSVNPPIARYSVGVKLKYLDTTKKCWN